MAPSSPDFTEDAKFALIRACHGLSFLDGGDTRPTDGIHMIYWLNFPTIDSAGHVRLRVTSAITVNGKRLVPGYTYYAESGEWQFTNACTELKNYPAKALFEYTGEMMLENPRQYKRCGLKSEQLKTYIREIYKIVRNKRTPDARRCLKALHNATSESYEKILDKGLHENLLDTRSNFAALVEELMNPVPEVVATPLSSPGAAGGGPEVDNFQSAHSVMPENQAGGNERMDSTLTGGSEINLEDDQPNTDLKAGFDTEYQTLQQLKASSDVCHIMASGTVGAISKDGVKIMMEIEEYFGFDPIRLAEEMLRLALSAAPIETVEFKKTSGSMTYTDHSDQEANYGRNRVKNDVRWLISLFSMRGVNFDKQEKKMDPEAAKLNGKLLARYGIPRKPAPKRLMGPSTITLPRIAATFAADTCWMQCKGMIKPMVPYADLLDQGESVPMCLFGTQFPALIPTDELAYPYATLLRDLALWVAWKFDDRIKSDGKKPLTSIEQMESYLQAARSNKIYTDSARVRFLKGLKVLKGDGTLYEEVFRVATKASSEWTQYSQREGRTRVQVKGQSVAAQILEALGGMGYSIRPEEGPAEEAEEA
uniref:Nucleoprotein n=1 Tax=Blatta orientalis phasmavirus 3 TaxID=3133447 RepID=A0AAT9J9W1_9VIRU